MTFKLLSQTTMFKSKLLALLIGTLFVKYVICNSFGTNDPTSEAQKVLSNDQETQPQRFQGYGGYYGGYGNGYGAYGYGSGYGNYGAYNGLGGSYLNGYNGYLSPYGNAYGSGYYNYPSFGTYNYYG